MVFSSLIFLFCFLPLVMLFYFCFGNKLRNLCLLSFSLFFYTWGEKEFALVLLGSITANYGLGIIIHRYRDCSIAKTYLVLGITLNLLLLAIFKYANFLVDNFNIVLGINNLTPVPLQPVHLPIGISFFTFQAMTYLIDIYKKEVSAQRNPINVGLYIALFPQLIAGPIVRYRDVAEQIVYRTVTSKKFAGGIERFIFGLGKKVLIANPLGAVSNTIFLLPQDELSTPLAWLGISCYTLQIYFDFSGYSDMAIGLGRTFGFHFLENFNYPYISKSIQEFWKRWHISLSCWFRDYLYIPLGGNRGTPIRTYINLIIVFTVCGFWHGASWNFIVWGLWHGFFLVIERMGLKNMLAKLWAPVQHIYVLLIVMIGWVFFRAETIPEAIVFLQAMFGFNQMDELKTPILFYFNPIAQVTFILGVICSTPCIQELKKWRMFRSESKDFWNNIIFTPLPFANSAFIIAIFLITITRLSVNAYNPFIYFKF